MNVRSFLRVLFAALLVGCILSPTAAQANSAEPPSLTVVVTAPPQGLSLTLQFPWETEMEGVPLTGEQKGWEGRYRFFNHMRPSAGRPLKGTVLLVQGEGVDFSCPLPDAAFQTYNNLLTLDLKAQQLTVGLSPLRTPLLVALRVALTLAIEGAVFFLLGYRQRRSWLIFLAVNLVTQGCLNAMLTGPNLGSYWMFAFLLGEALILVVELAAFVGLLRERRDRAPLYAIYANLASLLAGGLFLACLPV